MSGSLRKYEVSMALAASYTIEAETQDDAVAAVREMHSSELHKYLYAFGAFTIGDEVKDVTADYE